MSGQRHRISLSQAAALGVPLGIEQQISDARAKAREAVQLDLEDSIREAASRDTLKRLAAPPSAQKRRDGLRRKGILGDLPGWMASAKKRGREAKPPQQVDPTSSAPTEERQRKTPYGLEMQVAVGGQVRHRIKDFMETYSEHMRSMSDAERRAADLLIAGYDNAAKVTMTSARAYTGAPYTGNGGHHRMDDLTPKQIDDKTLFEDAYLEITRNTPTWWRILHNVILREPAKGRDRPMTAQEVGAMYTAYRAKETSTAAGVMGTKMALLRWLEALQVAMAHRGRRQQQRAALQAAITDHTAQKKLARR